MFKKIRDTVKAAVESVKIAVVNYRFKVQMIWGNRPMVFPQTTEESFKDFIDTSMAQFADFFADAFQPPTGPTLPESPG